MDPCPFVRILVGNLAVKIPVASKPARSGVHPSTSPCFCEIKLKNFPVQTVMVPLLPAETTAPEGQTLSATFQLDRSDLEKMTGKSLFAGKGRLKIAICTGRRGTTCGLNSRRLLGKISVPLNFEGTETRACVFHNGWISVGKNGRSEYSKPSAQVYLSVRAEPDPRFVFQFDGEPECSPQVLQIQGNIRQPVFTCKFNCKSNGERNARSRTMQSDPCTTRGWLSSLSSDRERPSKERKGWAITIHDLSGSPVAAASMVTPFVASPGSDRVSRSNPGAWLILRPAEGTWKPWGRLEAWRERGSSDALGYRFELTTEALGGGGMSSGILLAESSISTSKGGRFSIDMGGNGRATPACPNSPACSPRSSGDFGNCLWPFSAYRGFVMSSSLEGEGKVSKPEVQIAAQHVTCMEDAAVFVALSAAIDLSMDACRSFSQKLRKELVQNFGASSSY